MFCLTATDAGLSHLSGNPWGKKEILKSAIITDALTGNERKRWIVFEIRHVYGDYVCAGDMGGRSIKHKSSCGNKTLVQESHLLLKNVLCVQQRGSEATGKQSCCLLCWQWDVSTENSFCIKVKKLRGSRLQTGLLLCNFLFCFVFVIYFYFNFFLRIPIQYEQWKKTPQNVHSPFVFLRK